MEHPEIIVFFWPGSPWASKVTSYLSLRAIPFTECHQPITMPRPDLEALGVKYRRIPVVAIGRDIYCDTLLILQKLEELYPAATGKQHLSATNPEHMVLEKLLEKWTDVVVFPRAAADCIPLDHPLVQDPKFIKDRTELWGEDWSRETRAAKRPEALVTMRQCFELLESTILSDGRPWVTGDDGPMLADIHAAWIFDWMMQLEGSWPSELISKEKYPRTFAWCERYHAAVDAAGGKNEVVEGSEALKRVQSAKLDSESGGVDELDPLGLKKGQKVKLSPIDTGYTAQEEGELLALHSQEVVIGVKTKEDADVRLHCPRWNFRVMSA